MNDEKYLGTGWGFPISFNKQTGVATVSGEKDIRQSLEILFSTIPGERLFRFDYGCNLHAWVFSRLTVTEKRCFAGRLNMPFWRESLVLKWNLSKWK